MKINNHIQIISIFDLINMIKNNRLSFCQELSTPFDHNANNLKQYSETIENIVLGVQMPQIVIHSDIYIPIIISDNSLVQTIIKFAENQFPIVYPQYDFNLKNLYFKDFNFQQNRYFFESKIAIVKYLGNIDANLKCHIYRYANQNNLNLVPHINQKIREICFPQGSQILSDFTNVFKNNFHLYNAIPIQNHYQQNSLTLSLLLDFYFNFNINHLIMNKIMVTADENVLSFGLKDKLLSYFDLNVDEYGKSIFNNKLDVEKYIKEHDMLDKINVLLSTKQYHDVDFL